MSRLLYIDTSGKTATVALSRTGSPLIVRTHDHAQEQAALLNDMITEVLTAARIATVDVDAVCVCAGPGSYTGLRVGLSTAKGLAYALDKPLMLFNNLDLLARSYKGRGPLAIALKARAGEYFYAAYDTAGGQAAVPRHVFLQDMPDASGAILITDDETLFPGADRIVADPARAADMETWSAMAEERFTEGRFDDLAYSEPFYLKAAYTTQSKK